MSETEQETHDLRDEIDAARELVMELARKAEAFHGKESVTRITLSRAAQNLFLADLAEQERLQAHYLAVSGQTGDQ